jgi:UDP-N-acetylglucosamine/UDP-N-acetylgalactosamine diphosphorylase
MTTDLDAALIASGQGHLVDAVRRAPALRDQVEGLDLDLITQLVRTLVHSDSGHQAPGEIAPPRAIPLARDAAGTAQNAQAHRVGEQALREGRVAVVLLAGGQGTRLGFDGPKGDYPFAPITRRTLFAHHAAKVAAIRARYATPLPWFVLTSPANDTETQHSFASADFFGLDPGSVRFVVQGTLPAVDRVTGDVLLEAPDRLALSPDGHGGLLSALRRSGALDEMAAAGITLFQTFQVDNPALRLARPEVIGHHLMAGAQMSSLAVRKRTPAEKMGVIAQIDGRTGVVEYSDLPDELAEQRDAAGDLVFWAGNVAVHCMDVSFARQLTDDGLALPYHRAIKAVPYLGPDGILIEPTQANAVKFETFIFDALPFAENSVTLEVAREDDFSPIKNADGDDSPETARRDMNRIYARWLAAADVTVPHDDDGEPVDLEIDPRLALDPEQLAGNLPAGTTITGPTVLGPA